MKFQKIDVSIIIPNWNGKKLLKKNLPIVIEAIKSEPEYKTEIIIVDDASKDNSVVFLNRNFRNKVKLVVHAKNRGFGESCNDGVNMAKGKVVVLLNSDVVPHNGFLKPLISHFQDVNVFAVSCNDGGCHAVGYYHQGLIYHKPAPEISITTCNSFWVSGGSAAFNKHKWLKLGGFSNAFKPFYWEDTDLCYRALKRGWKIIWEPKSKVDHKHETTISGHFTRDYINQVSLKNQIIFFYRNVSDREFLLNSIFWTMVHCVKSHKFRKAYFNLIRQLPSVIEFRKKEKKVMTDKQILSLAR